MKMKIHIFKSIFNNIYAKNCSKSCSKYDDNNYKYEDNVLKVFRICISILYINGIPKVFVMFHKNYSKYFKNTLFYVYVVLYFNNENIR